MTLEKGKYYISEMGRVYFIKKEHFGVYYGCIVFRFLDNSFGTMSSDIFLFDVKGVGSNSNTVLIREFSINHHHIKFGR